MGHLSPRSLLTIAVLASAVAALGACTSSGGKTPRTAQPTSTATSPAAAPPANAISAAPPAAKTAPTRKEAAAPPPPPANVATAPRPNLGAPLPPVTNPSENACAPAPQPVESSTGSSNVRVKDCKRNQFVLLPVSLQSLIDSYVAECAAKCAPK